MAPSITFFKTDDLNRIPMQILKNRKLKLKGHELTNYEIKMLQWNHIEFTPLPEDIELDSQDKVYLEVDGVITWCFQVLA